MEVDTKGKEFGIQELFGNYQAKENNEEIYKELLEERKLKGRQEALQNKILELTKMIFKYWVRKG